MEREILLTGVGGQSVQLAAQILGRAALAEEREVLLLGTYGGTMRGGPSDSTLVVADAPIRTPPIVSRAWSAIALHHAFWEPTAARLEPHALVVLNSSLFEKPIDRASRRVHDVPATRIATDLGNPMAASLVLIGAFAALTALVELDSLDSAMRESVPSYRRQHLGANTQALAAGFRAVPAGAVPAWSGGAAE